MDEKNCEENVMSVNNNRDVLNQEDIKKKIFTIRKFQVLVDKDLAELYEVSTKRLNEQVK